MSLKPFLAILRLLVILIFFVFSFGVVSAKDSDALDSDQDGLSDELEVKVYKTDPFYPDTDKDGYLDGNEVYYKFDPNKSAPGDRLEKSIKVSLKNQTLSYFLGNYEVKTIKVSTGTRKNPTPKGKFAILQKKPTNHYKGPNYDYPNTRWNMQFLPSAKGSYYIHGAFWHNKFGKPMSRGCVNVSYADMEALYNWSDVGTKLEIY